MPRLSDQDKITVVELFPRQHWSCNMIAKKLGFSRPGIQKFLRLAGYNTSKSTARRIVLNCLNCNKSLSRPSCRVRSSKKHFCSTKCYLEFIRETEYKPYRHGQRIARAILQPIVLFLFGPSQKFVSHHKNGDDNNPTLSNLLAFPSQSDHLDYHKHQRLVSILMDGKNFVNLP